jgi:hypothetical protein
VILPLPSAGCRSAYASPNYHEGTFFAEQMVAYGEACAAKAVAAERAKIADMCGDMAAVSWAEWDEKADPIDQGKALALEHVAGLLVGPNARGKPLP